MESNRKFKAHPLSSPGDFYAVDGMCGSCGVPEVVAHDLVAWEDGESSHCFWKRQPETPHELEQAIKLLHTQDLGCHRYAGTDQEILQRLARECCDIYAPPPRVNNWNLGSGGTVDFRFVDTRSGFLVRLWDKLFPKN